VSHFAIPGFYDAIVPHAIPGPARAWTLASGVVELACAVASPARTRRLGATVAAVLFVAVLPANIQMAVDCGPGGPRQAIAYGRLPLQIPLVLWALAVRRAASGPAEGDPAVCAGLGGADRLIRCLLVAEVMVARGARISPGVRRWSPALRGAPGAPVATVVWLGDSTGAGTGAPACQGHCPNRLPQR